MDRFKDHHKAMSLIQNLPVALKEPFALLWETSPQMFAQAIEYILDIANTAPVSQSGTLGTTVPRINHNLKALGAFLEAPLRYADNSSPAVASAEDIDVEIRKALNAGEPVHLERFGDALDREKDDGEDDIPY